MLTFLLIVTVLLVTFGAASGGVSGGALIVHRPYNNRYSDATAARDDWR
jgi:hypothetical protein